MREFKNKEIQVLLKLVSKALFNSTANIDLNGVDLLSLYKESRLQTVVGLAFDALPSEVADIDANLYAEWRLFTIHIMQQNLRLEIADAALHKLLQENKVPHCTIKGTASAAYYPNPTLRQMGDIDLLVNKNHFRKTKQLMLNDGFIDGNHDTPFHSALKKNGIIYELHHSQLPLNLSRRLFPRLTEHLISSSVEHKSDIGTLLVPDKYHHGLSMLLHIYRHLEVGEGVGLRHLCDWAVFVNSIDEAEFVNIFEARLKKCGLWKFCRVLSYTAHIYIDMPKKSWFGEMDASLAENLMQEIIFAGNFGRKSGDKKANPIFLEEDNKNRKGIAKKLYILKRRVWRWNRFYKKHRWLYPIGLVCYSVRVLFQMVFHGKKLDRTESDDNARRTNNLFSNMNFFNPEK